MWPCLLAGALATPLDAGTDTAARYRDDFPVPIDYIDELRPSALAVAADVDLGDGFRRVELDVTLENTAGGVFYDAVLVPHGDTLLLGGVRLDEVRGATFGAVAAAGPGGTSTSVEPMVLEVPAGSTLVDDLVAGRVPLSVYANERPQVAEGNVVYTWTTGDDLAYHDGVNVPEDPFGPPPWDPTEGFTARLYYLGAVPDVFADWDRSEQLYVQPDPDVEYLWLPGGFHHFVVDDVLVDEANGGGWTVVIGGHVADAESLLDIYSHAAFSTVPGSWVAHRVGQTRVGQSPDGAALPAEERDRYTVPVRYNDVSLFDARASLSGSVHGHVLKPSVTVRVRPGASRITFGVDTDLTFAGQLEVHGTVVDAEAVDLYELCFPLPPLQFGPIELSQSLQLRHELSAEASLRAGTVFGVEKRVRYGYEVVCEGEPFACTTVVHDDPEPLDHVSPPQIQHTVDAFGEVGTRFDVSLWIAGARYPACDNGLELGLFAGVHGNLWIRPLDDPWWKMGYRGYVGGHVGFGALGFSLVDHDVELADIEVPDARTAEGPLVSPVAAGIDRWASGEDQRWLVAIDQQDTDNQNLQHVDAAVRTDGGVVVVATEASDHRLLRLDRFGELVSTRTLRRPVGRAPQAVAVLPDDRVVVAGSPAWAAVFEPDDEPLWAQSYDLSDGVNVNYGARVEDMAVVPLDGGGFEIVLVGVLNRGQVSQTEGLVVLLDDQGAVRWARYYEHDDRQELHGVTVTADGDLVVVGTTDDGPDAFSLRNAWMMRLDRDTGDILWDVVLPTTGRGGLLEDVVEAPDGSLYVVGQQSRTVTMSGSAYVARVSADGEDALAALLLHDAATDAVLDFERSPAVEVSDGTYDLLEGVALVQDGIVVVGHAGTDTRTAWLARLGPRLGPEWLTVLDGGAWDALSSVTATRDGLVVAGYSRSAVLSDVEPHDSHVIVGQVPFEGGLDLHPRYGHLVTDYLSGGAAELGWSDAQQGVVFVQDAHTVAHDATLDGQTDVLDTLLEETPTPECAHLLTATGHPTTTDPCDDLDLWPPVVRLFPQLTTAPPWRLGRSGSLELSVEIADESGVAASEVTVDGVVTAPGTLLSLADLVLGPHTFAAWAEDPSGNAATDEVVLEVIDDGVDTGGPPPPDPPPPARGRCGCASGPGTAAPWLTAGLLLLRRRGGGRRARRSRRTARGAAGHR